ncbi:MAG: hypothetical protein JJT76_06480 [Clostridiaceae bacterium]|nr:hypothetical protein [Clostridiaceae bacterium]
MLDKSIAATIDDLIDKYGNINEVIKRCGGEGYDNHIEFIEKLINYEVLVRLYPVEDEYFLYIHIFKVE